MRIQAERDHENSFLLKGNVHQRRKSATIMLISTLVSGDSRVHTSCVVGRPDLVQATLADIQVSNFSPHISLHRHPFAASGAFTITED
jgi:hypothetical protein